MSTTRALPLFLLLLQLGLPACLDISPEGVVEVLPNDGGGNGGGGGGGGGAETVFFSIDILPLFQANCIHCHGGAGGLDLQSWQDLMAGGNSGAVVIPGDAENSLIVRRLDGRRPPTMPLDGPPLTTAEIDVIRTWIDEGAKDN